MSAAVQFENGDAVLRLSYRDAAGQSDEITFRQPYTGRFERPAAEAAADVINAARQWAAEQRQLGECSAWDAAGNCY